ncbi:MAG: hypothetical protein K8J31_18285 [Anaerolineae bacterium]|nr:hypothetical protein [Anaerolineae bacterium]
MEIYLMDVDERRRVYRIISVSAAVMALVVVAVIVLDVRSLIQTNQPRIEAAVHQAISDTFPSTRPRFDAAGNFIEYPEDTRMPQDVTMRGYVERGQMIDGVVGMNRLEGWALEGAAGDQFLLDFEPLEGGYTWQMTVYQPDREMLAFTADSEAGYADFSLLPVQLPAEGTYFVVISAFGETGEYTLHVR